MRSLGSINVQYHVNRLFQLKHTLALRRANGPDIDSHALERRIKKLMSIQQARNSSLALARQHLQKRRQVLCANYFMRQYAMQQSRIRQRRVGMVSLGLERHNRPDRPRPVNEVQTGAEQARQSIGQGQPLLVGLLVRLSIQPRPQFHAGAALFCAVPWSSPPALSVPSAQREPQVKFSCACILQDLAQRSREEAEVLRFKVGDGGVGPEVEAREER